MRKIFLFIVATLFATNMWASPIFYYVEPEDVTAPMFITNIQYHPETQTITFDDSYPHQEGKPARYVLRFYNSADSRLFYYRDSYGILKIGTLQTPLEEKYEGKTTYAHWYESSPILTYDEVIQSGEPRSIFIGKQLKESLQAGASKVLIVIDGYVYASGVGDQNWWTNCYSIYLDDRFNAQCISVELPQFLQNALSLPKEAVSGKNYTVSSVIQATKAISFKLQRSTNGKSWRTVSTKQLSVAKAMKGDTILNEIAMDSTIADTLHLYRQIITDVATSKADTSEVKQIRCKYKMTIIMADGTKYENDMLPGTDFVFEEPADCNDLRITSALPLPVNHGKNYGTLSMPCCNVLMEYVTPSYIVKFLNADYTLLKVDTVACGDDAEAPADPTYGNYTFTGWSKDITNVHKSMSVLARYDIGDDYYLFVTLDDHANKVFPFDNFEGSETRAMVGDVLEFGAGIFAVTDASLYYETATWYSAEQRWLWPSQQEGGKKVGDYKAYTSGLLKQEVTVCYDANTQYIHPFEHRFAVRFYLLIAGVRVYSDPFEFDVYYPTGIRTSTAEGVRAENNFGDIVAGTPVMIPARSNDTIRVYGMYGSGGDCFTYQRVIKSSMAVDNGVDEEDNAYFLAPGELDTIVISVAQTAVVFDGAAPTQVFDFSAQGLGKYTAYYAEVVDCSGSIAKMPEDPESEGYIFTGWASWNSSDYPDNAYIHVPAGFTTVGFTAQWEEVAKVQQYTVRFYGKDGAELLDNQLVNECENAVPPAAPEVDGFHFVGWDKPYTTITVNTDITAIYGQDAKTWTVTYKNWDNSDLGTELVNDGEAAQGVPTTREGYDFAEWVDATTEQPVNMQHIFADITVKASFVEAVYTITYVMKLDGKNMYEMGKENVKHGDMPVLWSVLETLAKTDMEKELGEGEYELTILGWSPEITAATQDATYEMLFTWAPRKYTVIFQDWDHTELSKQAVEYGNSAIAPDDPVRDGYTFTGWDQDYKNVTGDMTVKAQYTINQYTVRFLNWDGTVLQSSEWEYNSTPVYSGETPVRAEDEENTYAFAGWDKEIAVATADADYTAVFTATAKAVYFTVTYYDWDLTILGTEKVEEGHDAQGLNPEPTRDGYIFAGWSKPLTNITSDLSVQATYKENPGTGIDDVQSDHVQCTKVLRDGVLYIMHNGTMYNVQGQRVK